MKTRSPVEYVYFVIAGVLLIGLGFLAGSLSQPTSQQIHMRLVEEHVEVIWGDWQKYRKDNPEAKYVYFRTYTGGDGMFGLWGDVSATNDLERIIEFVGSTYPPRRIHTGVKVWNTSFEEMEEMLEPFAEHYTFMNSKPSALKELETRGQ